MLSLMRGMAIALCLHFAAGDKPLCVDLNTATRTELMQLPKVGAKTAERIVVFRQQHGPFQRVEELMNVKGIGEKTFMLLKPHIRASISSKNTNKANAIADVKKQ